MADEKKKIHITQDGSGEGVGMLGAVILIGIGLLVVAAALRDDKAAIDVNMDLPKVDAPNPGK